MAKFKQYKGSPDIFTSEGKRITEQEAQTAGLFTPQGLSPEVEQMQTIRPDIAQESQFVPKAGTDITAEDLSTTPTVKLPVKTEDITDYTGLNKSVKVPKAPKEPTPLEKTQTEATGVIARAKELMGITAGKEAYEMEQKTAQGYAEKQAQIEDISAQIEALDVQAEAKKLEIEERPIPRPFIEKQQAAVSRENTIKKLNLSASLLAAQGKFNAAKLRVDQAVNAKYAKDEAELKNKITQLEFITKYELTPMETARKEELLAQAKKEEEKLKDKKAAQKEFDKLVIDAQAGGLPLSEAQEARDLFDKLYESGRIDEAYAIIMPYTSKAPKARTQLTEIGGRRVIVDLDTGKVVNDLGEIKDTDTETPLLKDTPEAQREKAIIQSNISEIDNLKTAPGLSKAVGASWLGRFTPFKADVLTGDVANFIGGVEQLVSNLSLDSLISAKERGATFGALSDSEMKILSASSTKIGTWRITNKDGNTTGYRASEKAFKEELDKISNFSRLDYILKGGNPEEVGAVITPDGKIWAQNSDGTLTQLR